VVYDLIVVGNGLAAQTLLFEIFSNDKKSQNFSVAQLYSEEITPSCSLKSTATVSLSGIEEGISELGEDLRESYFLFEKFIKEYSPAGVEALERYVTYTTDKEKAKMLRRYKNLSKLKHPLLKEEFEGTKLESFLITPHLYSSWFENFIKDKNIVKRESFVSSVIKNEAGFLECHLLGGEILLAKKVVLCTGAYSKILSHFYGLSETLEKSEVVAGSYLERFLDLNRASFYFTIDSHSLIYRQSDTKIIFGSSSIKGGFQAANLEELQNIFLQIQALISFNLGEFSDYKIITGQRHKGIRRRAFFKSLDSEDSLFLITGLYKNGYTFSLLAAKVIAELLLK